FSDVRLFEKFIANSGEIEIEKDAIQIKLKKKRNLPALLTSMSQFDTLKIPWLKNKSLIFSGLSHS
ncbi:MAG: hypothetical protein KKB32_01525, partial [Acidobacteria bacterium]|nr:hypothetical protein [Acidobacteriota bacterium]